MIDTHHMTWQERLEYKAIQRVELESTERRYRRLSVAWFAVFVPAFLLVVTGSTGAVFVAALLVSLVLMVPGYLVVTRYYNNHLRLDEVR